MKRGLLAVLMLVAACSGEDSPFSDLPVHEVHGDDFQTLTLEELAGQSDLIVSGVITEVALSDDIEPAPVLEDFGGETNFAVVLDVDEVVGGAFNGDMTITVEMYGVVLDTDNEPQAVYQVNGMPTPTVGSEEVWFLTETEPGVWAFTDVDDGRFSRSGDTLTALAQSAGPAAHRIEELGFDGLLETLR